MADPGFSRGCNLPDRSGESEVYNTSNQQKAMTILKMRTERPFASNRPIIVANRLHDAADRIVRDGSMMANGSTCGSNAGPAEIWTARMLARNARP